jgi:hypothetical protein
MTTKAKRVQVLGGPTSTLSAFTGRQREIIIDTTDWAPTIHDGLTPGGHKVQMQTARLSALLGLGLAADKLIYSTGADAFAASTLTTFARTLLAGASASAMLTTLGALGTSGDGSNVLVTAAGGTTARTMKDRGRDVVTVEDFGAVGDGVTDDTSAFAAAFSAMGAHGGTVLARRGPYYLGSDLRIPSNVALVGNLVMPGEIGNATDVTRDDYNNLNSALRLNPSAKITTGDNVAIRNAVIVNANITAFAPLGADDSAVQAVLDKFAGIAVDITGQDAFVTETMILGFSTGIRSRQAAGGWGQERTRLVRLMIDCTNGVDLEDQTDCPYLHQVHCIPRCTPRGASASKLYRSGVAINLGVGCDWPIVSDCFSYGYAAGFKISCNHATLTNCGADHIGSNANDSSIGYYITGNAKNATLIGCRTAAKDWGFRVDSTHATENYHRIIGCSSWGADSWNFSVENGTVNIQNCYSYGGNNGVRAISPSANCRVDNCVVVNNGTQKIVLSGTGNTGENNLVSGSAPDPTFDTVVTSYGKYIILPASGKDIEYTASGTAKHTFKAGGSTVATISNAGQIGVGVTSPGATFDVAQSLSHLRLATYQTTGGGGGIITLQHANGSVSAPSAVSAGDQLAGLFFAGRDSTGATTNQAALQVYAEDAFSSTAKGTRMTLSTTPAGGTTRAERLRIAADGSLTHRANATVVVDANSHLGLRSYTVGTLPSAGTSARLIFVSDGTANKRLAISDGTNWRWPDGTIVS